METAKNQLKKIASNVQRIEHCGMYVDLLSTSEKTVRIGCMPDIAKFLAYHGFREETVVLCDPKVSMAGDNYTGEEFVLWQAQARNAIQKHYTGNAQNVALMYRHLGYTFPYFFDTKRLSIVRKKWLARWFGRHPATPLYTKNDLQIQCEQGNIIVYDAGKPIYNYQEFAPKDQAEEHIEEILGTISRDQAHRDHLEITPIGMGNGFAGTVSNVIVRFAEYVIWIDPCGYPAHTLARHNIHWDDITHILITHNHEDHIQGLSACLQRAALHKQPLQLLTAKSVFALLKKQYRPLIPNCEKLMTPIFLEPGKTTQLGPISIESRWNHHVLPYGTLGIKISAGGKGFGYSGDTKFDTKLNRVLQRAELEPEWFVACQLIFHEVDFDNAASVHSHWKEVEVLQRALSGEVLVYHTPVLANAPLKLVEEGRRYLLE